MASVRNLLKKKILVGHRIVIYKRIKKSLRKWIFSLFKEKKGFDILTREKLFKNNDKYQILPFGAEENIIISEPFNGVDELPNLIKTTSLLTSAIGKFTLKKPFVAEVINAELVGSAAVGFDREGSLITETVMQDLVNIERYLPNGIPAQTLILKNLPSFGSPQLDTACSLLNWWSKNYSHWIVDCLLRLEGLEYYQEKTGRKLTLIIEPNPPGWKIESLKLLGYELDDCVAWKGSKIKVNRLIVPSFRREQAFPVSPAACQWLRQRLLSNLPNVESKQHSFSPRIYISRAKTTGRKVINEDAVLKALSPFGFVAYAPENMSFADEVRLFSQAEIVVAPHGSGLVNIIFAQNLSVIELFGSTGVPCFLVLAKSLGFQYGCLTADYNSRNNHSFEQNNNIMVDIPKLQVLVEEMLTMRYSDRHPVITTY
ncbi:glycosyltransferase family 61 protein [Scytonema millei]|uniref:glycosyltransferase family 61 protein n=1 Tax=Scytonema millei TaxID=1245922 RepID=UPI0005849920|nr:glycosyltransferase family 61 protein [Scytonema millei]